MKRPTEEEDEGADKRRGTSILGRIDLDESDVAQPVSAQVAAALKRSAARVLDLFREWDTGGDGTISRNEFRKAMPALGLDVDVAHVDSLVRRVPNAAPMTPL